MKQNIRATLEKIWFKIWIIKEKYLANFRNNSLSDGLDDRY